MRVISTDQLKPLKGIPYTDDHLRRLVKQGRFPAPIKLGPGKNAWLETEIDDWLKARAAERDALKAVDQKSSVKADETSNKRRRKAA